MIDLHSEIDFSTFIEEESEIQHLLVEACRKVEQDENDHLRKIKKPHLDDELLNHFVGNTLSTQSAASPSSRRQS